MLDAIPHKSMSFIIHMYNNDMHAPAVLQKLYSYTLFGLTIKIKFRAHHVTNLLGGLFKRGSK